MRRRFVLLGLACVLAVAAIATAPARAGTPHGTMPVPTPVTASVEYGTLLGPDYEDLWSVFLGDGQQLIVTMYSAEGEDFDLCLWAPGTTDISYKSGAVVRSMHYSGTESIKYVVPPGAGGTYYINVFSIFDPEASGSYHFTVDVQSPGSSVSITAPAVPGTVRTYHDYTARGTLRPLHFVEDTSVRVEFQKYSGGRWRAAGSVSATNEDYQGYTRYTVEYSFSGWGSGKIHWRVRAVHLADEMHPRKASAWRTFWLKV
jgi:hypothetical protein